MPCSSDYCISGTSLIYDDIYSVAGVYDSYDYFTGSTNGYYIFYSSGETRWCVAPNLGDPCELFGPSPITDTCPDLYPGIFNVGICVTTSTTTSACLDFDFEAVFDCSISPTPTVTPTITPTPTVTPTITPTNNCNVAANISAIKKPKTTPVPTQTPTPSTSQVVRPCNFSGTVQYNVVEGYIKCANSSKFENCFTGEFYFTTETIFDQNGQALIQDYVYGGFIDNVSVCFIFRGFVDYISGPSNVIITNIYGSVNEGKCIDCNVIPSQTPTPTPTLTPTPTVSLGPICNQYEISNTSLLVQEYKYYDCKNKLISPLPLPSSASTLVCSISEPIVYSPSMVVIILGPCPIPSQTPTPTPTLTPTQTPQAVYSWFLTSTSYGDSSLACLASGCVFPIYSDIPTLLVGDIVYNDSSFTSPFVGDGNWYRMNFNCDGSLVYAAQIDGSGNILDILTC
jgi:hypothetical protein